MTEQLRQTQTNNRGELPQLDKEQAQKTNNEHQT